MKLFIHFCSIPNLMNYQKTTMIDSMKSLARPAYIAILFVLVLPACSTTMQGIKEDFNVIKSKITGEKDSPPDSTSSQGETNTVQNNSSQPKTKNVYKGGYSKSLVQQIQLKLRKLGYYNGPESGEFNATTETAIQDFQLENDLDVNGKPSVSLLRVINSKLSI